MAQMMVDDLRRRNWSKKGPTQPRPDGSIPAPIQQRSRQDREPRCRRTASQHEGRCRGGSGPPRRCGRSCRFASAKLGGDPGAERHRRRDMPTFKSSSRSTIPTPSRREQYQPVRLSHADGGEAGFLTVCGSPERPDQFRGAPGVAQPGTQKSGVSACGIGNRFLPK